MALPLTLGTTMANKLLDLIEQSEAKWVDFRFTDTVAKNII